MSTATSDFAPRFALGSFADHSSKGNVNCPTRWTVHCVPIRPIRSSLQVNARVDESDGRQNPVV